MCIEEFLLFKMQEICPTHYVNAVVFNYIKSFFKKRCHAACKMFCCIRAEETLGAGMRWLT